MQEAGMRIAVGQFNELTDEKLRYAAQIGVSGIQLNTPIIPGETHWQEQDLRVLVERCKEYGLVFEAIENVPVHFYNKAMLGLPGRDEQIEHYRTTLRNMGRAGIPILGFHFIPNSVWRTERFAPGRGGAGCTKFDMADVEAKSTPDEWREFLPTSLGRQEAMPLFGEGETVVTAEQMWDNYAYFIKAVLPVAEEAGVKMALHPDDPPVPMLGGVARIFRIAGRLQARVGAQPDESRLGPRPVPRLLFGDARRRGERPRDDRVLRAQRADLLRPLPRRSGHRAELPGMLHRRRKLRSRRGHHAPEEQTASTVSCSTTTFPTWTTTPIGTIAAARTRSATCKG